MARAEEGGGDGRPRLADGEDEEVGVRSMEHEGLEPFTGVEVGKKFSMRSVFSADYINGASNYHIVKLLSKQGDRLVLFADNVVKVNRRAKMVRRVLLITDVALYILDSEFYCLRHRFALQAIEKVSLSVLNDNFFALSVPSEYDCLMASTRKTQIVAVLVEAIKNLAGSEEGLQVNFSNRFEYYMDSEHLREVRFEVVEGGVKTNFVDK